jgi:hypothetical protein
MRNTIGMKAFMEAAIQDSVTAETKQSPKKAKRKTE